MKTFIARFALFFLLSVSYHSVHGAGDDHEGHEHHSCACEAEELGFTIDCTNTAAMDAAIALLRSEGCQADCSSETCVLNWYIVQSHHDYCPEAGLPTDIEDGFHDFDQVCEPCEISRQLDSSVDPCPAPVCDDGSGNAAYARLVAAGCLSNCNEAACKDDFQILVAVHDNCPHDSLAQESEDGMHDLENTCVAFQCNSGSTEDPLVCDEPHDHDGVAPMAVLSALAVAVAAGMVL